jgi:hypothetical protein
MESMADDHAYSNADDDSTGIIVAKCFMHGAAFIYLVVVLLVACVFVTLMITIMIVPGVSLGVLSILGEVIASFTILFMAVGWLNAQVSQHIWKNQVKQKWLSLLGHGFLLSMNTLHDNQFDDAVRRSLDLRQVSHCQLPYPFVNYWILLQAYC